MKICAIRFLAVAFVLVPSLASIAVHAADFGEDSLSGDASPRVCDVSPLREADGSQQPDTPTCSSTQLGEIPKKSKMVSSIILIPKNGQRIPVGETFDINVKISHLDTGFFSDPESTYYSFSQQLNTEGVVKGHSHVVIQKLKSGDTPPDARKFEFFQGLNGVADGGGGVLGTTVEGGLLSPGLYRLCSMTSSFSHQGVLMPVAQRGAADDCIRFKVVQG